MPDKVILLHRLYSNVDNSYVPREMYLFSSEVIAIERQEDDGTGSELLTKNCGRILVSETPEEVLAKMSIDLTTGTGQFGFGRNGGEA